MSDKYAALKQAAEKATWGDWTAYQPHKGARGHEVKVGIKAVAQHCLKNDAGYIALAGPKVVLELLAERDADKRRIIELSQKCENDPRLHEVIDLKEHIAELGARTLTVKLPDCDLGAVQHMSGGSDDYCNGFVDGTQNAIKGLTKDCAAAGISLKIEGE